MALATRCPSCSTIFRISTAQAAAKGGMVRCGQCRNVFNSLDALVRVEDLEVIDEIALVPPVANEAPATAEPDLAPTAVDDAPIPVIEEVPASTATIGDDPHDGVEPTVFGDAPARAVISEWWLPEPDAAPAPRTEKSASETDSAVGHRDDAGQLLSGRRTDLQWSGGSLAGTSPSFMNAGEAPTTGRRSVRWIFGVLTVIALIGLVGQAAYFWRDELAARWSPARPWLQMACRSLQCKVDYPAHLDAISIESARIQAAAGPNLNVYALQMLMQNREPIDVRYPHLELVLTDVQDRPILRRALRPEDYLPPGRDAARSGFPAESELPVTFTFELSDLRFVGFRVERFYP